MSRLTRLRAFKWPTIGYEMQKNLLSRVRERREGGLSAITAIGARLQDPPKQVAYARGAFESFLEHAGLSARELNGLHVLELGPGEDLAVALRFLAAGAEQVTCIDRFTFDVDPAWEHEVHRLLLADLDDAGRQRLEGVLTADGELTIDGERLRAVRGVGIEEGAAQLSGSRFDLIVSVAVLEHVYDLAASFRAMDALLEPGGLMVHQVDLRDHGMFSGGGHHPLEFLTVDDRVYRLMTSHTGAPNRGRIRTYYELLTALRHEATIKVTNVGGAREDISPYSERIEVPLALAESIEQLRPRLSPRFASLTTEELATTGIVFRSRKSPLPR